VLTHSPSSWSVSRSKIEVMSASAAVWTAERAGLRETEAAGKRREGWRGSLECGMKSAGENLMGWKRIPRTWPLMEWKIPLTRPTVTHSRSIGIQTRCSKNNDACRRERKTNVKERERKRGRVYLLMVPLSARIRKAMCSKEIDEQTAGATTALLRLSPSPSHNFMISREWRIGRRSFIAA